MQPLWSRLVCPRRVDQPLSSAGFAGASLFWGVAGRSAPRGARRPSDGGRSSPPSYRAPALPAQSCSGGGREERAVRRATTVGRGVKPPAELPTDDQLGVALARQHLDRRPGVAL